MSRHQPALQGEPATKSELHHQAHGFLIGPDDRIIKFSPSWDQQARKQHRPFLFSQYLMGKDFFTLLQGREVIHIYRLIFQKLRRYPNKVIKFMTRCDTASTVIEGVVTMEGLASNEIYSYYHYTKKQTRIRHPSLSEIQLKSHLTMCSWCMSFYDETSEKWLSLEEALDRFQLFGEKATPKISHTCCERCREAIARQI